MRESDSTERMTLAQTPVQKVDARYSTTNNVAGNQNQINVVNYFNNKVHNVSQTHFESNIIPPPPQPVPPGIFYGRNEIVDNLVRVLDCPERIRIAILGTGGIGKTSLILHLMNHNKILARFDDRCHFVACESITSAEALAMALLLVLGKSPISSENTVTTLQRVLNTIPRTLLVLDNFETPWDPEASRSSVEDLLATIGSKRSISLVITMRGSVPPSVVTWTHADVIMPLSPEAARKTYFAINPSSNDLDESELATLDVLLKELDWVPLAIRLLATIGRGFTPTYLLRQWKEEKTTLLHIRNHRLDSIAVSISLSLSQLSMTENPDAVQLLGVLCLLPDGLFNWIERISQIGCGFTRVHHLARVLLQTSLCFLIGGTLKVLSPIRHYILTNRPADAHHISNLETFCWNLINDQALRRLEPEFPEVRKVMDPEMGNIGHLIRNAIQKHPSLAVVEATINLSHYIHLTVPSTELLTEVKGYTKSLNDTSMSARWSQAMGINLFMQHRYYEAFSELMEAQGKFIEIGYVLGATECSRYMGEILHMQHRRDEATVVLKQVREKFTEIGYVKGVAQCSQSLSDILIMQLKYTEATSALKEAREKFNEVGSVVGSAGCSRRMGDILRMQHRYEEAIAVLKETREKFIGIGDIRGAAQCSRSIGQILSAQKQYTEASYVLNSARDQAVQIGNKLEEANCLYALCINRWLEKRYEEAIEFLIKARTQYLDIGIHEQVEKSDRLLANIAAALPDDNGLLTVD